MHFAEPLKATRDGLSGAFAFQGGKSPRIAEADSTEQLTPFTFTHISTLCHIIFPIYVIRVLSSLCSFFYLTER